MSETIEREIVFDATRARAYMVAPEGEYVCSTIKIVGDMPKPDSITLTGIGKTRSLDEAEMWLHLGIEPFGKGA